MGDRSGIEWTDATWNPVTGCSVVSPGCANCYAMRLAGTRLQYHPSRAGLTTMSKAGPVWNGQVRLNEQWLEQPLRWRRPRRIFVCAHGDLFHPSVPDAWIDHVFAVMALAPQHQFQVLTKRPERMQAILHHMTECLVNAQALLATKGLGPDDGPRLVDEWPHLAGSVAHPSFDILSFRCWPLPNVWLGTSAENQATADERIPDLLATPAAVRFVSLEPLLGPIDLHSALCRETGSSPSCPACLQTLDWVIVGGESGPGARPMHPDWASSLRDQCQQAGVPFFFKQWGGWRPICEGGPDWYADLYHPAPEHDPEAERRCKVPCEVLQLDGSRSFDFPKGAMTVFRVGKKRAGRLLDGRTWNEMPEAAGR